MISDTHVHTCFSGDSETPVRSQIDRAVELGMKELTITDHHDYDVDSGDIDFNLDFEKYLPCLEKLKEEYKDKIQLHIGVELGLQPHLKEYFNSLLSRYSLDFVIGSTHFVHGMDPYFPEFFDGRDGRQALIEYFQVYLENIKTLDCFDSAGHLDYVVRYGPHKNTFYKAEDYQEYIDQILKILIDRGQALECNTGGFRAGIGQTNPHQDILKRYRQLGGELITVGSDAHVSKDLASDFNLTAGILRECGFRYYCTYKNRKPVFHPL